jgi:transposase
MPTVTKPYPKEFRDDVVWVAMNREPGVELSQIAADFGIHFRTLYAWTKKADVDAGKRPGTTAEAAAELARPPRASGLHLRLCLKIGRSTGNPKHGHEA